MPTLGPNVTDPSDTTVSAGVVNSSVNSAPPAFGSSKKSEKAKRKNNDQDDGAANSCSSSKRRSLRDRNTITTPVAGKLSPMELIGSLTFDIAKAEEGWKVKEHRNGITRSYVSDCGKMAFDNFEAIGEFAIVKKDWMEKLADDEGAIDALQRMARDGDERAVGALGDLGMSLDDSDDDDDGDDVIEEDTCLESPAEQANETKTKKRRKSGTKTKSEKKLSIAAKNEGKTSKTTKKRSTGSTAKVELSSLDVTGMFDPKCNYFDISDSDTADLPSKFTFKLKDLDVTGMFDPKHNYGVASGMEVGKTEG